MSTEKNGTAPDEVAVPALALQLMAQSAKDAAFTTNTLLDSYQQQIAELQAELDLIRDNVSDLLGGPWMPTSDAIRQAMRPSRAQVMHVVTSREVTR